jgi:hypothetical protein
MQRLVGSLSSEGRTCIVAQPAGTAGQPHLSLSKQRDGLAKLAQQAPHFLVVGGHHRRLHLAPQLNLLHQLLLLAHVLRAGLRASENACEPSS